MAARKQEPTPESDYFIGPDDKVYKIHPPEVCSEDGGDEFSCVFHRPTDHRMITWPLALDTDDEHPKVWAGYPDGRALFLPMTMRVCQAGHLVPDPDAVCYWERMVGAIFPANLLPVCPEVTALPGTEGESILYTEHTLWMDRNRPGWRTRAAVPITHHRSR